MAVSEVFQKILHQHGLEGVTFTGGEPLAQARSLATLGHRCQEKGLSVVTYTGYTYEHIRQAQCADWKALLDVTDLLLAGPFMQDCTDTHLSWVGSSNQKFIFLSNRYLHLQGQLDGLSNQLEIQVHDKGVHLNGTVPEQEILTLQQDLNELGLQLATKRGSGYGETD